MTMTYGPPELRIRWETDPDPYDWGDIDPTPEDWDMLERFGVLGCTLETRAPACACCGQKSWEYATSLWSIVSDDDYLRSIERELMFDVR